MADRLDQERPSIIDANREDRQRAEQAGVATTTRARLGFDDQRIDARIKARRALGRLPDPVGQPAAAWKTEGGLDVARVCSPLGVILMGCDARPHVTLNAVACA